MSIRNSMSKDKNRGEYILKGVESITTEWVQFPENDLSDKACQWNNNIWIVEDKPAIEICKMYSWLS